MPEQHKSIATGVIGLGAMGSGMALNLHRHGALSTAWNRSREHIAAWAAAARITLPQVGHGEEDISTLFHLKTGLYE